VMAAVEGGDHVNVRVIARKLHAKQMRRRRAVAKRLERLRASRPAPVVEEKPDVGGRRPVVPVEPEPELDLGLKPAPGESSVDPGYEAGRRYGVPAYAWRSKASRDANPLAPGGNSIFGSDWR
jgi:hypothetical protein